MTWNQFCKKVREREEETSPDRLGGRKTLGDKFERWEEREERREVNTTTEGLK